MTEPLQLSDAIDWDQAAALLELHDFYRTAPQVAIQRSFGIPRLWRVYLRGDGRHPDAGPYEGIAAALAVALSPANLERWKAEGKI